MQDNLTKLDNVTKILLIVLVVAITYFFVFLIMGSFFIKQPTSMMEVMNQTIYGSNRTSILIFSLIIALSIGIIFSFYLSKIQTKDKEYHIIKKALSKDERTILDEIKKAGEVTQDSLRFRLNWSKAKISTILTNLDKMSLIQRERIGKTYKVYLQK
ncbi:MAG: hypothetical protein WC584_00955 [Candidatus Pacearchaeota archaeon]